MRLFSTAGTSLSPSRSPYKDEFPLINFIFTYLSSLPCERLEEGSHGLAEDRQQGLVRISLVEYGNTDLRIYNIFFSFELCTIPDREWACPLQYASISWWIQPETWNILVFLVLLLLTCVDLSVLYSTSLRTLKVTITSSSPSWESEYLTSKKPLFSIYRLNGSKSFLC